MSLAVETSWTSNNDAFVCFPEIDLSTFIRTPQTFFLNWIKSTTLLIAVYLSFVSFIFFLFALQWMDHHFKIIVIVVIASVLVVGVVLLICCCMNKKQKLPLPEPPQVQRRMIVSDPTHQPRGIHVDNGKIFYIIVYCRFLLVFNFSLS